MGSGGVGLISADFEIAWAFRGSSEDARLRRAVTSRQNVPYILHILEETGIPITWATVGHLFWSGVSADARASLMRIFRGRRRIFAGMGLVSTRSMHGLENRSSLVRPDLIELIRSSKIKHEFGSHLFSHIDFSEDTSTPKLVEQEIEACTQVMAPHGLRLRSLVYPFNNMGHQYLDLLGRMGLTAVPHRDKRSGFPTPSERRRAFTNSTRA